MADRIYAVSAHPLRDVSGDALRYIDSVRYIIGLRASVAWRQASMGRWAEFACETLFH